MLVIDASAALTWLLPDEVNPISQRVYLDVLAEEVQASVPAIWRTEIANTLLVSERRKRIPLEEANQLMEDLATVPVLIQPPLDLHRIRQTLRLARTHTLSFYDATYLELVLKLNGQLFSFDRAMVRAAKACGITCIDTTH